MDIQFYPTGATLAYKAWAKFKNKNIVRVLEPNAGEAHLLQPLLDRGEFRYNRTIPVDCVEIDMSRHSILREKNFNVVGIDFMQFGGSSIYSHIIMNPPFAEGVKHVLKAWEILFDGELVAILNAESIRNPYSAERKMLVNLIETHGSVEFLVDEFLSSDTERKTGVEVALIHLEKISNFEMDFLSGLEVDSMSSIGLATGYKELNEVAIHEGAIDNAVTVFNAAVKAVREVVFASAKARYYTNLLGETMESLQSKDKDVAKESGKANLDTVRKDLQERYEELKNRAWTQILRSTQVASRLSSKAQKRLESEFENVKALEFTVANIYGFILGLINKSAEINIEMTCDVFDSITKYHSENRAYFKGWRSNDKHRTAAFRVKCTRFVIPGHKHDGWTRSPHYDTSRFLADFDKVFSMLDGKSESDISLEAAFNNNFAELKLGKRIKTSFFDLRFYPGVGTIHFFPTNKKLIDRFNRLVGRHRKWLPQEGEMVSDAFWLQYDKADTFTSEIQSEIAKRSKSRSWWNGVEQDIHSNDIDLRDRATTELEEAIDAVLLKHGIDPGLMIESNHSQEKLLLLAA